MPPFTADGSNVVLGIPDSAADLGCNGTAEGPVDGVLELLADGLINGASENISVGIAEGELQLHLPKAS